MQRLLCRVNDVVIRANIEERGAAIKSDPTCNTFFSEHFLRGLELRAAS